MRLCMWFQSTFSVLVSDMPRVSVLPIRRGYPTQIPLAMRRRRIAVKQNMLTSHPAIVQTTGRNIGHSGIYGQRHTC